MSIVHLAFLVFLATAPVLAFADGLLALGLAAIGAGILLLLVIGAMGRVAAGHVTTLARAPSILVALPLLWLLLQLLPISAGGLSRSIWDSAASGLGGAVWPHLTVDVGLTLLALCRYLVLIAMAVLALALSIERQRAEKCFWLLAGVSVVMAILLAIQSFIDLRIPGWNEPGAARNVFVFASALGIVWWAAASILIIERFERGGGDLTKSLLQPLGGTLAMMVICAAAVLVADARYAAFAGLCGAFAVVTIYFVRSIGLGFRAAVAMGCIGVLAAGAVLWSEGRPVPGMGIAQRYAAQADGELIAVANRIATEVGPAGSGAGTFAIVYPLYGAPRPSADHLVAPTFTSQIAIEGGRFALYAFVLLSAALTLLCMRGAFNRGRDIFYPAAGAGTAVAAVIIAFCDAGLGNLGSSVLLAGMLGLAIAQTASRTH